MFIIAHFGIEGTVTVPSIGQICIRIQIFGRISNSVYNVYGSAKKTKQRGLYRIAESWTIPQAMMKWEALCSYSAWSAINKDRGEAFTSSPPPPHGSPSQTEHFFLFYREKKSLSRGSFFSVSVVTG